MAKETFYFSHDYNARVDEKIKALIRKHGMAGYGVYWSIVEDLYNNANALQTDYEGIGYDLHTDATIIKSVINDFGLFVFDGDKFGSMSVQRRIDARNEKSQAARASATYRWTKQKHDANAMRTQCECNAIKERKGKEKKEKEIVEDTQTPTEKTKFDIFNEWLKSNYPNVASMKTQMTEQNLKNLVDTYGKDVVNDYLMQMENKIDIAIKYKSVYLTLLTWIKRGLKK